MHSQTYTTAMTRKLSSSSFMRWPTADDYADGLLDRSPVTSFLMNAPTAATATATNFHAFLKKSINHANNPVFTATTAAPPVMRAARPYLAILSPERYSA